MQINSNLYIIKIGTDSLVDDKGSLRGELVLKVLILVRDIFKRGDRALIVTSGAVKLGKKFIGKTDISRSVAASIGNPLLFNEYRKIAKKLNLPVAEFLLSRSCFVDKQQFFGLQKTFSELFQNKIVPLVNENDALVSGTDDSFGDNDSLAAVLAITLNAKKVFLVSNVDGLFTADPKVDSGAILIKEVKDLSDNFLKYCSKQTSSGGTGGMISKLKVARVCTAVGIETQIINGLCPENFSKIFTKENIGTIFTARSIDLPISNKERWIFASKNSTGSIEIDDGAVQAILLGKSLLAVGVKKTYGQFENKEVVEIINRKKRGIAFGVVDFSKNEIEKILKTNNKHKNRIIHANNIFKIKD